MKPWLFCVGMFCLSCGNEPEMEAVAATKTTSSTQDTFTVDTVTYIDSVDAPIAPAPIVPRPSGIYRFEMPYGANSQILHTIAFYPNYFLLQEEYRGKKDSISITRGTWSPSQGYIWLYKDQLVRGRYAWKGDTLQYFSPRLNQKFSMVKLTPAATNPVWKEKEKTGAVLFAVGTEPFWSLQISRLDTAELNMPDWDQPLRTHLSLISRQKDSLVYQATTDSLLVTVYPYFCSDGMSDFTYSHKLSINYKGQLFQGCGIAF